jgi:hypothetical protein
LDVPFLHIVMRRAGGASSNRMRCGYVKDFRDYWIIRFRG